MAREVNVRIEFVRIGEIDNLNEKFHAEIRIISNWIENETVENNNKDQEVNWNPQIFIKNALNEIKETNFYKIETSSHGKMITEIKTIKGNNK